MIVVEALVVILVSGLIGAYIGYMIGFSSNSISQKVTTTSDGNIVIQSGGNIITGSSTKCKYCGSSS